MPWHRRPQHHARLLLGHELQQQQAGAADAHRQQRGAVHKRVRQRLQRVLRHRQPGDEGRLACTSAADAGASGVVSGDEQGSRAAEQCAARH